MHSNEVIAKIEEMRETYQKDMDAMRDQIWRTWTERDMKLYEWMIQIEREQMETMDNMDKEIADAINALPKMDVMKSV